jgi:outer membrane protein assembly factor BamB
MVLMLTISAAFMSMPQTNALINSTVTMQFFNHAGINSPNQFIFLPTPCVLFYPDTIEIRPEVMVGTDMALADATVTFTAPDGSTDVINGPFRVTPETVLSHVITTQVTTGVGVATVYTPDQKGEWNVSFYWPGDSVYAATSYNATFTVGEHVPKRPTFAVLSMRPYPAVGLGQDLLVNAWITPPPILQKDTYRDYLFTFTRPDGTLYYTIPFDTSEMPGTVWFTIPLDMVGNWTIKFEYPGDWFNLPSSVTRTILVQNESINVGYPDTSLPTEPWTFPINVQNREWRKIAGPWYQSAYNASMGSWNPYTEGVRTAHILWKLDSYGQLGGFIGSPHSMEAGSGQAVYGGGDTGIYGSSVPSINTIMAGRGYYTAGGNIICIDMRTGETLWKTPGSFNSGSERGSTAALYSFGSRFIVYDAITGAMILNVTGMSASLFDPQLQLAYTYVASKDPTAGGGRLICWDTSGNQADFASRIVWNVSAPRTFSSGNNLYADGAPELIENGLLVKPDGGTGMPFMGFICINQTTGEVVTNTTDIADFGDPDTWIFQQGPAESGGYGYYFRPTVPLKNNGYGFSAFNVKTGELAWVSEKTDDPWGCFYAYMPVACGHGLVLALSYSGVYGLNATNGEIVWHYIDRDVYNEEPYDSNIAPNGSSYSSYSFGSVGAVIGGGVVYAPNTEHSPTFYYRGQGLVGIDAFTGEKLWKICGIYAPTAIAYGTLVASDNVNGYTYAFSKGETAVSVSSSAKIVAKGTAVLIEGSVLDQSPAQKGTPAVSDESMSAWMEYLHMQQPRPTNATGVTVKLTAVDQSGNKVDVGTTTSDSAGLYAYTWTPSNTGTYKIIASFEGSDSYYASSAETVVGVTTAASLSSVSPSTTSSSSTTSPSTVSPSISESPSVSVSPSTVQTQAPASTGLSSSTMYIAIAAVVIIVAVVAAALVLRKRRK